MREHCANCVMKHLAQAQILMDECRLGYPLHKYLAIGHMAEAESEILGLDPLIALTIREHRKAFEADTGYMVPVMTLIGVISALPGEAL